MSADLVTDLVTASEPESERIEQADDRPAVGSWWWVTSKSGQESDYDRPGIVPLGILDFRCLAIFLDAASGVDGANNPLVMLEMPSYRDRR
jgi:hypothetical protein